MEWQWTKIYDKSSNVVTIKIHLFSKNRIPNIFFSPWKIYFLFARDMDNGSLHLSWEENVAFSRLCSQGKMGSHSWNNAVCYAANHENSSSTHSNAIWISAFTSDTNMCTHSYEYVPATRVRWCCLFRLLRKGNICIDTHLNRLPLVPYNTNSIWSSRNSIHTIHTHLTRTNSILFYSRSNN